MDKNTLVGFGLIAAVLIGFTFLQRPSEQQQIAQKHYQDSIQALAQKDDKAKRAEASAALTNENAAATMVDSTATFYNAAKGTESFATLENDLVKLTFSNKGGRVYSALLKKYNGQDKKPLVLFDKDDVSMNFLFYNKKEKIETKDYYYQVVNKTDSSLTMRLAVDDKSYIDFIYTMHKGNYMVDFSVKATGMVDKLSPSINYMDIEWKQKLRQAEKGFKYENRYAYLMYKYDGANTDHLSETKESNTSITGRLKWIGYKTQYFSSVFIADKNFDKNVLSTKLEQEGSGYLKDYSADMSVSFDSKGAQPTNMHFYFGPNHYKTLKAFDAGKDEINKLELDQLVPLGWSFLRWINKVFTINIFDWLSSLGLSMGMVLLFMTIIVKIVIFYFTYKSYMSSARMRVLKPQIDLIGQKYPKKEDAMKKQQETMALYSKYGVSPMSGCLPMLLQMPIVIALFMFVPSAIELRQQSFLWANDLSTFDAFIQWNQHLPFIGNHISLFCLLMSLANILNTKYTMAQQDTGQQQMPGMKAMMYVMPVMFIFILNDYAAGLNYYYLVSTLISIFTMIALKKFVNDDKILSKLEAFKDSGKAKKKTGLMAKMAKMQEEQERMAKERDRLKAKRQGK
ncbi:membrane protein insertase YidC [uncultured Bacteroides sp.]|uniref:membrane protein insertase YidC n=1 Tax=uncultured Bacteroides sp. TaxID=162156 RepID=UPI002AAAE38E|nr:membrane protein insertase YidC [uncultured Bacteroides sp.]